jgi:hypothetical protein
VPEYAQLFCTAHKHKARILTWGLASWDGETCPVTEYYGWARANTTAGKAPPAGNKVYSKTAVRDWAKRTAECVAAKGFDGVVLDMGETFCLYTSCGTAGYPFPACSCVLKTVCN